MKAIVQTKKIRSMLYYPQKKKLESTHKNPILIHFIHPHLTIHWKCHLLCVQAKWWCVLVYNLLRFSSLCYDYDVAHYHTSPSSTFKDIMSCPCWHYIYNPQHCIMACGNTMSWGMQMQHIHFTLSVCTSSFTIITTHKMLLSPREEEETCSSMVVFMLHTRGSESRKTLTFKSIS